MKKNTQLFFLAVLVALANGCRKDIGKENTPKLTLPTVIDSVLLPFSCEDTAADWKKYATDPTKIPSRKAGPLGVSRAIYDPINPDILYYIEPDTMANSFRKISCLYQYNRSTRIKIKLDSDIMYNIDINKNGWLVYDKMNWNIYKIKTNGDSLTQLTKDGQSQVPQWSEDGKYIYVSNANSAKSGKYRMDASGKIIDTLKFAIPSCDLVHTKDDFLYYNNNINGTNGIIERNMQTQQERIILSANNNFGEWMKSFQFGVNNDAVYWESDNGLYKTDLNTLATIQIINSQKNSLNVVMAYWVSPINGRIIATQENYKVLNYDNVDYNCYLLEFEPDGKCRRRLTLPN